MARSDHDLLVVGGGVYGVALLLEAARRGLKAALVERNDFGSGTSSNSLRILHGGFRYLQSVDLVRMAQSVNERRRWARCFPELVRPLTCVMPLYADGLKRASVVRVALVMNDLLSASRNAGVLPALHIPRGRIADVVEVGRICPLIRTAGLEGAALWTDYRALSSERLLIEMLRWAVQMGAQAANYTAAVELMTDGGRVIGVRARDAEANREHEIRASVVVNCTGPESRLLSARWDREVVDLFRPSLAFNVLIDRELPSRHALGVAAPQAGAPVLFLVPCGGGVLAGTWHLPRPDQTTAAAPSEQELQQFIDSVSAALPTWGVSIKHVRRVFAGLLPVTNSDTVNLSGREELVDHGSRGGPVGLVSLSGVKFTTARATAQRAMKLILRLLRRTAPQPEEDVPRTVAPGTTLLTDASRLKGEGAGSSAEWLRRCVREESVRCLDDLLLRRTNWVTTTADMAELAGQVSAMIGDLPGHAHTATGAADSRRYGEIGS
ncbi:MAG TPA: FAD-dependent oxidoreductase [Steroidobacteraceae bacterium]|nr:FAD-dependent oxidoreductase [Steroidobacteraceae bacterium]